MVWLKFYDTERELFHRENYVHVTKNKRKLEKASKKLAKHFGFVFNGVKFRKMRSYGRAFRDARTVKFNKDEPLTLLVFVHELAHLWSYTLGFIGHKKELLRLIKRLMRYCLKSKTLKKLLEIN